MSLELKNLNLSSIELLRLEFAALPTAGLTTWPLLGPFGCCRAETVPFFTGKWVTEDADAIDDGLDLSDDVLSRVTTEEDLGCGMKDPVCGEPDLEPFTEVLGAARPEMPWGLRIILGCCTVAMVAAN